MYKEKGFAPILILVVILLIVGLGVFFYFFLRANSSHTGANNPTIPLGVVTDDERNPCETQDSTYCHESPDVERWEDDGLP